MRDNFAVTVLIVEKLVLRQLEENRIDNDTNKIMGDIEMPHM